MTAFRINPMDPAAMELHLEDDAQTAALGARLAGSVGRGDTVCLSGPLGAGKSALARAVISCKLGIDAGGIPSPSYTLVNVYEVGNLEIWHADLYRLSDASELDELGLCDAVPAALTLIEWPDRLGKAIPVRRLEIGLSYATGGGRLARITPLGGGWEKVEACLREG